jgi:hypothetical protein
MFVVGSFQDWMPIKMKTRRVLAIEKIPMAEPAPATVLNIDNTSLMYAEFVKPGFHYFYFVQGQERCFISPRYEIVRFKNTNVFLNRVKVVYVKQEFETVFVAKKYAEEEELFMIEHSVFKRYEGEQIPKRQVMLEKAFEIDIEFSKINRVCKSDDLELLKVKACLWNHYPRLMNIFLWEIGRGEIPTISWNDTTSYAKKTNILDGVIVDLSTFDRTFILTNVNDHGYFSSAERNLNRYEFIEFIVRFAVIKMKEKTKRVSTIVDSIELLLYECIYPHSSICDGWQYRQRELYNVEVNEYLARNEKVIMLMLSHDLSPIETHNKKRYVELKEVRSYVHKLELKTPVSEMMVGVCFYESLFMCIDTVRTNRMVEMQPWEFMVFLCRFITEYYKTTPYAKERTVLKLNAFLPKFLNVIYKDPLFSLEEEFEYDIKMRKRRERERRRAEGLESEEDDDDAYDSEDCSEEEGGGEAKAGDKKIVELTYK